MESSDKDEEFGAAKSSPLKAWPDTNFGQAFSSLGFEIWVWRPDKPATAMILVGNSVIAMQKIDK